MWPVNLTSDLGSCILSSEYVIDYQETCQYVSRGRVAKRMICKTKTYSSAKAVRSPGPRGNIASRGFWSRWISSVPTYSQMAYGNLRKWLRKECAIRNNIRHLPKEITVASLRLTRQLPTVTKQWRYMLALRAHGCWGHKTTAVIALETERR